MEILRTTLSAPYTLHVSYAHCTVQCTASTAKSGRGIVATRLGKRGAKGSRSGRRMAAHAARGQARREALGRAIGGAKAHRSRLEAALSFRDVFWRLRLQDSGMSSSAVHQRSLPSLWGTVFRCFDAFDDGDAAAHQPAHLHWPTARSAPLLFGAWRPRRDIRCRAWSIQAEAWSMEHGAKSMGGRGTLPRPSLVQVEKPPRENRSVVAVVAVFVQPVAHAQATVHRHGRRFTSSCLRTREEYERAAWTAALGRLCSVLVWPSLNGSTGKTSITTS
jgi:hypothetical protein